MKFVNALVEAQKSELRNDEDVFIFGLDVSDHKSIFGSTEGILEEFGDDRIFITPISEEGMTGVAIGAALNGKKPIHIHIRADFLLLAANQLLNMCSSLKYISNGQLELPIVFRAVIGRGWGQGAQHSKSLHGMFSQFPGLQILMPTSPQDAYSMLKYAIQDKSPTIFLEHRWLYDIDGDVDLTLEYDQIKSEVIKEGTDITIVSLSWMTIEAQMAAEILEKQNISVEIVDLKTIKPLDTETIFKSVKKTKKCLIVDYDWTTSGLASEISALINENLFGQLEKPVKRLGFGDFPCPTARHLEDEFYPNAKNILSAIAEILDIDLLDTSKIEFYSYEKRFKGPF